MANTGINLQLYYFGYMSRCWIRLLWIIKSRNRHETLCLNVQKMGDRKVGSWESSCCLLQQWRVADRTSIIADCPLNRQLSNCLKPCCLQNSLWIHNANYRAQTCQDFDRCLGSENINFIYAFYVFKYLCKRCWLMQLKRSICVHCHMKSLWHFSFTPPKRKTEENLAKIT